MARQLQGIGERAIVLQVGRKSLVYSSPLANSRGWLHSTWLGVGHPASEVLVCGHFSVLQCGAVTNIDQNLIRPCAHLLTGPYYSADLFQICRPLVQVVTVLVQTVMASHFKNRRRVSHPKAGCVKARLSLDSIIPKCVSDVPQLCTSICGYLL